MSTTLITPIKDNYLDQLLIIPCMEHNLSLISICTTLPLCLVLHPFDYKI
jgi:hypothetical protein